MAEQNDDFNPFTDAELDAIVGTLSRIAKINDSPLRKLGHKDSNRGKRRALALLLGHRGEGSVGISALRRACDKESLLITRGDRANFSQDLKKDAARGLWTLATHKVGRRLAGYLTLTDEGKRLGAAYAQIVNLEGARGRLIENARHIHDTIVVTKKIPSCPYCREDVVGDIDLAQCNRGCGCIAHASCMQSVRHKRDPRCPANLGGYGDRYRRTSWCNGYMDIISVPFGPITREEAAILRGDALAIKSYTDIKTLDGKGEVGDVLPPDLGEAKPIGSPVRVY